jgi:DNA-binding IscR family transcriptional regulator
VSVGALFRALDAPFADTLCDSYTGNRPSCAHAGDCSVRPVWSELQRRIYGFLDGVTIEDIAEGTVPTAPQLVPLTSLRRARR